MTRSPRAVALLFLLLAIPLTADAQAPRRVARVGYLSIATVDFDRSWLASFRQGMRDLGYVEGQNLIIEDRHAGGRPERLPDLAAELGARKVDVIVLYGAFMAKKLPTTIPIVFTVAPDPVGAGLVTSLARPGGNITGLSDTQADLIPKRLELLKEAAPSRPRVAVLFNPDNATSVLQMNAARTAAPALGLTVLPVEVKGPNRGDIDAAFTAIAAEGGGALLSTAEPTIGAHRSRIADFALKNRIPTMGTVREWATGGFLLSYGTDFHELWRRTATYVDKILKGARPGELPIEQPTKFELVINLKTARAIGVTIPQSLRLRADQVIE